MNHKGGAKTKALKAKMGNEISKKTKHRGYLLHKKVGNDMNNKG